MSKKDYLKNVFPLAISFLVGGIVMFFIPSFFSSNHHSWFIDNQTQIYERNSLAAAVDKIYDAVLVIQDGSGENGSGFVYKTDEKYAYILTNEHVLHESLEVQVITVDDQEISAKVLGKDKYLDLAVLRIPKKSVHMVATIGNSEKAKLGDTVFIVGTPLGYNFRGSVTAGVLSGKDRMVSTSLTEIGSAEWIMKVLQVDASINPGNSGGPLLNVNGEVIGICSLKFVKETVEGMGFAIPIEFAMKHVDRLEKGEEISWPNLGITMVNVSDKEKLYSNDLSLPKDITEGVVVLEVKDSSNASQAGLKRGDVLVEINHVKVKNIAYLRYELFQYRVSDSIEITYIRNQKRITKKILLH